MGKLFEQYHLSVERDGDDFILRQIDHSGNSEGVAIHLSQIRTLAEVAGLLEPAQPNALPNGLERRLLRIRKEAAELADFLGGIASFPPQPGMTEDESMAHALWQSIADLMSDYGMDDFGADATPGAGTTPGTDAQGCPLASAKGSDEGEHQPGATGSASGHSERFNDAEPGLF